MATFNTSEILTSAHKWAKENAAAWIKYNINDCKNYRNVFAYHLRAVWKQKKEAVAKANEVFETFSISLNYSETELRGLVKKMGGKWNADLKIWTVVCRKSDLGKLESKVIGLSKIADRMIPKGSGHTARNPFFSFGKEYDYDFER